MGVVSWKCYEGYMVKGPKVLFFKKERKYAVEVSPNILGRRVCSDN